MARTLIEFRAEKGLYLKDVAEKIDISKEELSEIENLEIVPEYIAERLIVAYNLPEDYFAVENVAQPIKPIENLKAYFFKTSLGWYVVFTLALGLLTSFFISVTSIMNQFLPPETVEVIKNFIDFFFDIFTVVATIYYCNIFAKNIVKKTGLSGDIYKYRYLYEVIPSGVVASLSIVSTLFIGVIYNHAMADESKMYLIWIGNGINIAFSILLTILVAYIMASLLNIAVIDDEIAKAKKHKIMAILVTVSTVLAFALTIFANTLEEAPRYDTIIRRIFVYGIYIATAWSVYLAKDKNKNKEKIAFTILPLISIADMVIFGLIDLF